MSREQLGLWVDYAHKHQALILFDAAYEAFIRDERLPHTIYEIPGAREVAIEFRSFSKSAGFTGTRCAYTVVPRDCRAWDAAGREQSLHYPFLAEIYDGKIIRYILIEIGRASCRERV